MQQPNRNKVKKPILIKDKQENPQKNTYEDSLKLYNLGKQKRKELEKNYKNLKSTSYDNKDVDPLNDFKQGEVSKQEWDDYIKTGIKPVNMIYTNYKDVKGNNNKIGENITIPEYKKPLGISNHNNKNNINNIEKLKALGIVSDNEKIKSNINIDNISKAKIPKYYNVEDIVHGKMGDSTSNYKHYLENGELQELAPEPYNTRKITPVYKNGGTINNNIMLQPKQTDPKYKTFVDSTLNANKDKDFVKRLYDGKYGSIQIPGVQGRSTHYMASADNRVYPTVVNINGKLKYLQGRDAYNYANKSGEYIDFKTPKDANKFAENGYKQGTNVLKYSFGGIINNNDMKYTTRLPKNKRHIAPSPIIQPKSITGNTTGLGTALSFAGPAMGLISGLTGEQDALDARDAMLASMIEGKKISDTQDNIGYKVNGNNDYNYYAYGGDLPQQELPQKEDPKEKRAKLELIAKANRENILRKKDSIIKRNLNATGLTREQYQAKQIADAKKPNVSLEGLQTTDCNKRGDKKGSCSTGATMGGDSLKDVKAYGGDISNSSTTGKFNTTGGDLIPISDTAEVAVGNTHGSNKIDGQYGITLNDGQKDVAEVENQEVITDGERVFSDRLKFDKNNTYADKMKKIASMSAKIEDKLSKTKDTKSRNGYERMLAGHKMAEDVLYKHQEENQEKEGLKVLDKMAYGGNIPKMLNGGNDFLKSLLDNTDNFRRSSNKGIVDTTNPVIEPSQINGEKPKTFMNYLSPSLIDNGVNALLTATTPQLAKPIKNIPQRLKTIYNANPELAGVSRDTTAVEQNILQNTANSADARANIASARLNGMIARGNILGRKENIETQLINQDKENKQNVDASNVALSNNFIDKSFDRANDIQTRTSGNFANFSEDVKGAKTAIGMDKYYREQLLLDLQNDITGSKARAYKQNAQLMADPDIARMVNATLSSRKLIPIQ